jgi:hypothetical protein
VSILQKELFATDEEAKQDRTAQWVETNPSNICIFPTDISFTPPHGTTLKALIWMFADVKKVGFLPP